MNIKDVQDKSYDLLCVIDDICKKNNIPYYLDSGTEIGAIREKDIIPWDDDIDIKLFLKDYPAFKEAMESNLPSHLHLVEPNDFSPAFYDFAVRIIDDRYTLRKITSEDIYYKNLQNHLGIDVFLIFHIPDNKILQLLSYCRIKFIYGMGMGHRNTIEYNKFTLFEKIVVKISSSFGKMFSSKKICDHFYSVIRKYDSNGSNTLWQTFLLKEEISKKEWFEDTSYGELRGRKFPVPAGFDEELKKQYGDYMKPPKDIEAYAQHLDKEDRYQFES